MEKYLIPAIAMPAFFVAQLALGEDSWTIQTATEWKAAIESNEGLTIEKGVASPTAKAGSLRTKMKSFKEKRSAKSLTIEQSALWQNWEAKPRVGPKNLRDAPVFLTMGPGDYWMFGRYGGMPKKGKQPFEATDAKLKGFDVPLKTTTIPTQFNAPGGLVKGKGGYHAWQSKDMVHWVHHGCVTPGFAKWVTTAEQV
ncbi:MAG: hypothetical protein HOI65_17790, partial [Opitutae bacterium]|nr:hypothetical protein [Opitutae bacterium]